MGPGGKISQIAGSYSSGWISLIQHHYDGSTSGR